jgi:hypothetical protein
VRGDDPAVRRKMLALREEGLTVAEVARRMNFSYQYAWALLRGLHRVTVPSDSDERGGSTGNPSPSIEARGLADWVRRGVMTIQEVRELIAMSPRDRAVLKRLGHGVTEAAGYRAAVLREFDLVVEREQLVDRCAPKSKVAPPPMPAIMEVQDVFEEDQLAVCD